MGNLMDNNQNISVRLANDSDFEQIFEIWTSGIQNSFDTSSVDIKDVKEKFLSIFMLRQGIFNYWVALDEFDKIVGWQSFSKTTQNPLKDWQYAESSTYVHKDYRKLGIADLLVDTAMDEAEKSQLQYVIAYVSLTNDIIRKMAIAKGWTEVGVLPSSKKSDNKFPKLFIVRPV
jgi:L-amino acid N-acyltransferase YncA